MSGKIQNEDIKSSAELAAAGATDASLPNDTKIYVTASGLNKTLKEAIEDNDLSGGGGFSVQSINSNVTLTTSSSNYVDTTAARTLGMPASPTTGDQLRIKDASNQAGTNPITLTSAAGFEGLVSSYLLESNGGSWTWEYNGTYWYIVG